MRLSPVLAVACLCAGALLLAGCSSNSFLGRRMNNFTAYYNTYYNAEQELEAGERALRRDDEPVDRTRFLSLFTTAPQQGTRGRDDHFEKAIKKGADLLREHPDSKWVDEALLVIGKAYFYQGNFVGAEGKFQEVLALEGGGSRRAAEATLWLGRTLTAARRYEEAAEVLAGGIAREGTPRRLRGAMQVALGEGYVREGRYEEAADALAEGLGFVSGDLGGRAAFLLGQTLDELERHEEAADAYARVLRYKPLYPLAYAAQLNRALALGLHGDPEAGLALLGRLSSDDKYFDNRSEIELARARVLAASGQPEDAVTLARRLLYDPDPSSRVSAIRGEVHYRLGEFYRDGLLRYRLAAAHFDTAATALRTPPVTGERYTRVAIQHADRQAEAFTSFARVAAEVSEADSLLRLGALPEEEFRAAIAEIRERRRREAERQAALERQQREAAGFGGTTGFDTGRTTSDAPPAGASGGAAEAGFLNFRNPVRVQEAMAQFQFTWGDRPLVPNWRRSAAVAGAVAMQEAVGQDAEGLGGVASQNTGLPGPYVDLSAIPRDPVSQGRVRAERAAARYELGNALFFGISRPDSAAAWYRLVIEEDGDLPVAARAYYALAETRRALGAEAEAQGLYEALIEYYPESDMAAQARERLSLSTPLADAGTPSADADYRAAYALWQRGRYRQAVADFLRIGADTTGSETAARALLAAGAAFAEWVQHDSLALLAPLPAGVLPPAFALGSAASAPDASPPAADTLGTLSPPPVMPTDTLASEPDTLAGGEPIPLPAVPDTLARAPVDSLAPETDSLALGTDSLALGADSLALGADSLATVPATAPDEGFTLDALYGLVETRYGGTPFAERARALREALNERRAAPVELPDTAAADPSADAPAVRDGGWGLYGRGVEPDSSGYAWYLGPADTPEETLARVEALLAQGYRVDVFGEDEPILVVGQFQTEEEGLAAHDALPPELAADAALLPVALLGARFDLEGYQRSGVPADDADVSADEAPAEEAPAGAVGLPEGGPPSEEGMDASESDLSGAPAPPPPSDD